MTPTLSVEAVQESVAWSAPTALVARPVGVDGGVVSGQAAVVTLIGGGAGDVACGVDGGDAERVASSRR